MSLSPTLGRNEKVEQHIKKKICKLNALRFWVEGGVIPLYVWPCSHCLRSPQFSPRILPISGIRVVGLRLGFSQQVVSEPLVCGLGEYSLTLY